MDEAVLHAADGHALDAEAVRCGASGNIGINVVADGDLAELVLPADHWSYIGSSIGSSSEKSPSVSPSLRLLALVVVFMPSL